MTSYQDIQGAKKDKIEEYKQHSYFWSVRQWGMSWELIWVMRRIYHFSLWFHPLQDIPKYGSGGNQWWSMTKEPKSPCFRQFNKMEWSMKWSIIISITWEESLEPPLWCHQCTRDAISKNDSWCKYFVLIEITHWQTLSLVAMEKKSLKS